MISSESIPPVELEDAICALQPGTLGLVERQSGRRLVIVAENNKNTPYRISVEVINQFTDDKTAIEMEFWLVIESNGGQRKHTTLDHGIVEIALKLRRDVIAAAIVNQFGWVRQNFPKLSALVERSSLERTKSNPGQKGKSKRV